MSRSKMKEYKRLLAFIATAILLLAAVPARSAAQLEDLPAPFVTNGRFNAYIVVGANAAVSDVIGAIEVAAAFAQRATSPVGGATAGQATIDVMTFKGTGDAAVSIYSSDDPSSTLFAGHGAPTDDAKAILPNYTYTLNDINYTAVERAKIRNITVDEHLGITIPVNSIVHEAWLIYTDNSSDVDDVIGKTIRVAGTNYYVVNFTQNGNITLGESTEYKEVTIPWSTTIAGKAVSINAISADGNYAKVTVGSTTKTVNITGGAANTVEDVTFVITNVVNWGAYITADVSLIASTERWEHNKDWPRDTRFTVDLSTNGKVTLKNKQAITLSDVGNFTGPAGSWTFYYKEKEQEPSNSNTWSIGEADQTTAKVDTTVVNSTSGNTSFHVDLIPGMTLWYCYDDPTVSVCDSRDMPLTEYFTSGTRYYKLVDTDGATYIRFAVTANKTGFDDTVSGGGVRVVDAGNSSNTGALTTGSYKVLSTGTNISRTANNEVRIYLSGPKLQKGAQSYYLRIGVSGIYTGTGTQLTGPQTYGEKLSWDGSKFTLTEPDGSSWYVVFSKNATDGSVYVSSYNLPTNNTNTSYGTYVVYNNISDTYDWNTSGFVSFTVYEKDAVSAIGHWVFTPLQLRLGEQKAVGNTTIKLTDVTGVGGVTVNPVDVGFAKLDTELSLVGVDKPLIIVGGPAINRFAAQLITAADIGENKYLIKYFSTTPFGKPALVIAGWEAPDTICACKHVAGYLLSSWPPLTGTSEVHACSEYFASV